MSKEAIKGLAPAIVWERFYEISQYPRPSKKEEKILAYLRGFFDQHGIRYKEDSVHNLIASVPATKGYENAPVVVLQAHVDMVCEKNKGTQHDFDNDPITLRQVDGWITADGTTLGSDNGIGVAAALAIVTDPDAVHGPLEILLTVDEETGLTGASNLDGSMINGKYLLNLDSEEDGAFYVGCSGGIDTAGTYKIQWENLPEGTESFELMVSGLKGGHSGLDINTGRANALKLLAHSLKQLESFGALISAISGGSKRNAIPREAEAEVWLPSANSGKAVEVINNLSKAFLVEYGSVEPDLKITLTKKSSQSVKVFSSVLTKNIINLLLAMPNAVQRMSADIPGLVETSTNLATIVMSDDTVVVGTSQRSSIESAKKNLAASVKAAFELSGAEVTTGDGYPGWKPNMDSTIMKISVDAFKKLFGKEPEIKAIHAGLECGILGDKKPGLDMISFGPTITGAHSPDEKIEIKTVDKFYRLLKSILQSVATLN